MRLNIFLLFLTSLQSLAVSYSQESRVSINLNEVSIVDIFNEIEQQSEFRIFYRADEIDLSKKYSIAYNDESIAYMLDDLLKGSKFTYELVDKIIVITSYKQQPKVTGIVTDAATGEPVAGVYVRIDGTNTGNITDGTGRYSVDIPSPDAVLVFSFIGYNTEKIPVAGQTKLDVSLIAELTALDEVVVVGYGTQKKLNLTGAVDQVTAEAFEKRSVSNVTQALQGVVPNLNIKLSDGKPSRTSSFNIRGTTSIGQGGSALILIDGVEGDPALLNPNDIESVSVLKDAASSAIYGARGTFGVVLITTKNPTKGKASVTYSSNFSVQKPTAIPDNVTDGYVYATHFREAYNAWNNYASLPSKINKSQLYSDAWLENFRLRKEQGITDEVVTEDDGTYTYYANTDWYDALYKDHVFTQDHNLTISGGTDKADFYLSGRLYDYGGLFQYNTDDYQMINMRAKASLQATSWLRFTNNLEYSSSDYHNPINVGEGGSIWRNIADEGHPTEPIFNPDGSLTMSAAYTVGDFIYGKNGLDTHKNILKNKTGFNTSFFNNKFRIYGDFTFSSFDNNSVQTRVPVPYSKVEGTKVWLSEKYNDMENIDRNTLYTSSNIYTEYENTFADMHHFKGMIGYNYETSRYERVSVQRNGLLIEDAESLNLALGESVTTSARYEKWRIAGTFFRLNYDFKSRYLLEINGNYYGSTKFPSDQQFGFFPSVSAGWRVSEEPFWKVSNSLVSDLKLRASYGSLGNGNVDPYKYLELLEIRKSARVINGALNSYTLAPPVIPESLTWETTTSADFGLDFGMIKGKFRFTGDYYIRKTTDMYTQGVTLPAVFGADSPKGNYADMTTKGWEVSLSWQDDFTLADKPFNYELRASLCDFTAVIDRYNNTTKSLSDYYEGMKVGEIWGYKTDGLFQSQDEIEGYVNTIIKSSSNGTVYPGDIKFVDNNHNGQIDYGDNTATNPGDRVIVGNSEPRYIYSFKVAADWNGIFFSVFMQGVGKQDWFPDKESGFWGQYNRPYNNLPEWHLNNYWTSENTGAYLPRYAGYNSSTGYGNTVTDRYLQNVAYLRLKNLQIGYSLPESWLSKVKMREAQIYLTGENLWCWSPLYKHTKDFDVTNTSGSDKDLTEGNSGDNYSYPLMKSISVGLSITF